MSKKFFFLLIAGLTGGYALGFGVQRIRTTAPPPYPPFPPHELGQGTVLASTGDLQGVAATEITARDGYVAWVDLGAENQIVLSKDGEILARFAPEGEGPGEMQVPWSLHIRGEDLLVFDVSGSLFRVPLAGPYTPERLTYGLGGSLPNDFFLLPDGRAVFNPVGVESLVKVWNGKEGSESELIPIGTSPGFQFLQSLGPSLRADAPTSHLSVSGDTLGVVGFQFTGELAFVDLRTGESRALRLLPDRLKSETKKGMKQVSSKLPLGYQAISANDSLIYALFIGKPLDEAKLTYSFDARDVHVFSWTGKLVGIYRLGTSAGDIAVDGKLLYATVPEPWPEVRKWELTNIPVTRLLQSTCEPEDVPDA